MQKNLNQNNLRNFHRIKNIFLRRKNDIRFFSLEIFSSEFAYFINEGVELFIKNGFESYFQTAKYFWKILTQRNT